MSRSGKVNCRQSERWISAHGDGELGPEETAALHQHLARCGPCRTRFVEMERMERALFDAHRLPLRTPEAIPDRVMAAIAREPVRPVLRPARRTESSVTSRRALAGTAAVALAGLAAAVYPWPRPPQPPAGSPSAQGRMASVPWVDVGPRSGGPVRAKVASRATGARFRQHGHDGAVPAAAHPHALAHHTAVDTDGGVGLKDRSPLLPEVALRRSVLSHTATRKRGHSHDMEASAAPVILTVPFVPSAAAARGPAAPGPGPRRIRQGRHHRRSVPAVSPTPLVRYPVGAEPTGYRSAEASACVSPARLHQVDGVALARDDASDWKAIAPDAAVHVDQRVRSGDASRVVLDLAGGIALRMNAETEVVPMRAPEADAPYWVVRLVRGELFARAPQGGPGIKVMTPVGDIFSREGEFTVRASDPFVTQLSVAKGSASLENNGDRTQAAEGMEIACRLGDSPDPPQPIADRQLAFRWAYAPIPGEQRPIHDPS